MALAKKCNRCGKYYDPYPAGNRNRCNGIRKCFILDNGTVSYNNDAIDLCEECMKAFDEFMIGGKFDND